MVLWERRVNPAATRSFPTSSTLICFEEPDQGRWVRLRALTVGTQPLQVPGGFYGGCVVVYVWGVDLECRLVSTS